MTLFLGDSAQTPLMDASMTVTMRRRIFELWGLGLGAVALGLGLCLWSYDVGDPSPFSATSQPAMNWLGEPGAWIADALVRHIGLGAWALVALLAVWSVRFLLHIGEERIWARLIPMLPALILVPLFASTHAVFEDWPLSRTGLGGMLGDAGARVLLDMIPMADSAALTFLTLGLGVALVLIGGSALGFSLAEVLRLVNWMSLSLGTVIEHGAMTAIRLTRTAVTQTRDAYRTYSTKPRSETLEPAEPTGSWRVGMPKIPDVGSAQKAAGAATMPKFARNLKMPKMPDLAKLGEIGGKLKIGAPTLSLGRRTEPELSAMRMTGAGYPEERLGDIDAPHMDQRDAIEPTLVRPGDRSDHAEDEDGAATPERDGTALRAVFDRLGLDNSPMPDEPPVDTARVHERADLSDPMAEQARPPVERDMRAPRRSRKAEAERQPQLALDTAPADLFEQPPLALLQKPVNVSRAQTSDIALEENARMLETVLEDYGVRGEIVAVKPGPVVTLYELEPAPGLKASRVIGLADDIARSMSALAARVSTVPGRSIIGIELPNTEREKVWIRDLFETRDYGDAHFPLSLALGKDISGTPVVANLAKMPHLLIAGTTGSGKSVAINTMILSLLYRLTPKQCRLIMIDPKMLELSVYDNIPHLLSPVVTDPKKAIVALKWVVAEMEERYRRMSKMGVRNIDGYNARVRDAIERGEDFSRTVQTGFDEATGEPVYETETFEPEEMPFIVVIVDEMADLMMVAGKEIEACIQRLAQMARASGIHLIMATQRPSVDVITGTIKANFPTRISFQVTSKIDSRTILGEQGAEQLLGMGDMLYMAGGGRVQRVHGPFVSDEEVEEVVRHLKQQGAPDYVSSVTEGVDEEAQANIDAKLGLAQAGDGEDALYDKAVAIVARDRKCSTSYIQRKLAIGYNKAARLVEQMEDQGVVTAANAVGKREILIEER
ncbi:MAG: DNA translocase FtsK [Pseudomonadota bacterium]